MSCEANSENCRKESQEFGHSEEGDRCDNSDGGSNGNLQQNADNDKTLSSDIGAIGVIDPCADKHVHEEPVLVVTPEGQRQSWLLEVLQSAEDSPESVTSVSSENESDGGSWTFEDGPDANLKSYELQIQNMTSINEALKARARKAEKEQSERDEAFKRELKDIHLKHAESLLAKKEQHDYELSEKIRAKDELFYNHGRLMGKYHTACEQIKDQTEKIKDLDAKLATHAEVLNQVKAPDGSIFTHKQRQDIVDELKRDSKAQKEFYRNQIKTLEHQVARKTARLNKGTEESHELENKLLALTNELSNEQQKCRDVQAKLELEKKSHLDVEETAKRNFDSQIQEAQATVENQGMQIQQMDNIIRSLQAHLVATQQSYAAAMGTVQNLHRAQEKSIEESREKARQHRHDMERISKEHKSVCDWHSKTEAALKENITSLVESINSMADSHASERSQWRNASYAMQEEIRNLRSANHIPMKDKNDIDAQLPGKTLVANLSSSRTPGFDVLAAAVDIEYKASLFKEEGETYNVAGKRSKTPPGLPNFRFPKRQVTPRKKMAEADIDQGTKAMATPTAVHSDEPKNYSVPTTTTVAAHSDKPTQPPKTEPASARGLSSGPPTKPPAISMIPTPTKPQPENQSKETPPVTEKPISSRSFSVYCGKPSSIKSQGLTTQSIEEFPWSKAISKERGAAPGAAPGDPT